ncbi:MAG: 4Fe-4S dicluster domain-containing protein [Candidatus Cloacimonetes bacterium]|nr:4Fe-4S dicluster domain-containing protein [Candidatus Cloacimonadota bacterium]
MLKKIRISIAVVILIAVTVLFLDFTGVVHAYLGWSARIQFVPAFYAKNFAIFFSLILLTLILGRIKCSVLCPLGIYQDIVSKISRIRKKNRFSYRPARKILRYTILGCFVVSLVAGLGFITVLLEPYSIYGRIISQIFQPAYLWLNNGLAYFAERMDSYAFYNVDVWVRSGIALMVGILSFIIIGIFAWKSGRGYCNSICPVGSFLSLFTKFSLFKIYIDKDKCNSCGLCEKKCKSACINSKLQTIDYTRCVTCYNCIDNCPQGCISYTYKRNKEHQPSLINEENTSRRGFISGSVLFFLGIFTRSFAQYFEFDGGLAPLEPKKSPSRSHPIIPPGAENIRNFRRRCTGCQLCVSACPNHVLRADKGINGFLQPHLSFEKGFCRPECVRCSQICPTLAITPITTVEKSATQIGYAVWKSDLCVVNVDNVTCDLCSHSCPAAAITLVAKDPENPRSLRIPIIDIGRCIGCGACEYLCPARPYSAIYVEGIDTHRTV